MGSEPERPASFLRLNPREIGARIADINDYSGGGTAAALTAASAAAVAELVLKLSARRKSNTKLLPDIQRAIERVSQLADSFYSAADTDSAVFQRMMETRRQARQSGDWRDHHQALRAAAVSPVEIAEQIVELLTIVDTHIPHASRFTVSDLGAAATLAHGSLQSALLTAEVNIGLLRASDLESMTLVREIDERRGALEKDAERITHSSIQHTKEALRAGADTRPANHERL